MKKNEFAPLHVSFVDNAATFDNEHHSNTLLKKTIEKFSLGRVMVIGDVMVDEYLFGDSERISPEAPVPIIKIEKESFLIGGAGNVARNIRSLGGKVYLLGFTGEDYFGNTLVDLFDSEDISSYLVQTNDRPTIIKTRVIARQQQIVRIDRELTQEYLKLEYDLLLQKIDLLLNEIDAIILSDYGKGLISSYFMDNFFNLLKKRNKKLPVLVDPKPQNFLLYTSSTLITPNLKETKECSRMPVKTKEEIIKAGKYILDTIRIPYLVTTLGAQGMAIFFNSGEIWHIDTVARHVYDVTGAGDTVIGTMALALSSGAGLLESCIIANFAAGIVLGEIGASVTTQEQLLCAIEDGITKHIERWA